MVLDIETGGVLAVIPKDHLYIWRNEHTDKVLVYLDLLVSSDNKHLFIAESPAIENIALSERYSPYMPNRDVLNRPQLEAQKSVLSEKYHPSVDKNIDFTWLNPRFLSRGIEDRVPTVTSCPTSVAVRGCVHSWINENENLD